MIRLEVRVDSITWYSLQDKVIIDPKIIGQLMGRRGDFEGILYWGLQMLIFSSLTAFVYANKIN